jgi:hypothetical protein
LKVADQLVHALVLRMKEKRISQLTPLHIKGEENSMTDIPSRSYMAVSPSGTAIQKKTY